jgi:hypothetical protein
MSWFGRFAGKMLALGKNGRKRDSQYPPEEDVGRNIAQRQFRHRAPADETIRSPMSNALRCLPELPLRSVPAYGARFCLSNEGKNPNC